jgi:hypothetical protein
VEVEVRVQSEETLQAAPCLAMVEMVQPAALVAQALFMLVAVAAAVMVAALLELVVLVAVAQEAGLETAQMELPIEAVAAVALTVAALAAQVVLAL